MVRGPPHPHLSRTLGFAGGVHPLGNGILPAPLSWVLLFRRSCRQAACGELARFEVPGLARGGHSRLCGTAGPPEIRAPPPPRFPSIISKCCPCTEMCKECWAHFKSRSVLPSCPLVVFFCFVLFFFCLCQFHFHQCCWEVLASSTFTDAEYYQSFSFFAHLMGRKIPNIILTCISQGPICNLSNNCLLSVQQIFLYTI